MITLITGTPGAGKTAYAVQQLQKLLAASDRPVFVVGIPELQLPHELAPPPEQWVTVSHDPHTGVPVERWAFPDGALIICDEAQTVYRPRPATSKVPAHVSALERHRHQGLDFWLITQSPNLLDANVRRLAGKHVHLRGTWAGRKLLEWCEATDPTSRSERSASVTRGYRLPKSVFGLYKSASLHVEQSRRMPLRLYGLGLGFLVMAGVGYYLYGSIAPRFDSHYYADAAPTSVGALHDVISSEPGAAPVRSVSPDDFKPRLLSFPETAPIYDEDRKIQQIPHVAGCVATADRCTCFTQQGTDAFLPVESCRGWLANRPFNPFTDPPASPSAPTFQPRSDLVESVQNVPASRVHFIPSGRAESVAVTTDLRGYSRGGGGGYGGGQITPSSGSGSGSSSSSAGSAGTRSR